MEEESSFAQETVKKNPLMFLIVRSEEEMEKATLSPSTSGPNHLRILIV